VLPDPEEYPDLEAEAVIVNVSAEMDENDVVNCPFGSVVPEFEDKEPPLVLRLTETPDTAFPPEVTVTVIVEDCEVVMLLGFALT